MILKIPYGLLPLPLSPQVSLAFDIITLVLNVLAIVSHVTWMIRRRFHLLVLTALCFLAALNAASYILLFSGDMWVWPLDQFIVGARKILMITIMQQWIESMDEILESRKKAKSIRNLSYLVNLIIFIMVATRMAIASPFLDTVPIALTALETMSCAWLTTQAAVCESHTHDLSLKRTQIVRLLTLMLLHTISSLAYLILMPAVGIPIDWFWLILVSVPFDAMSGYARSPKAIRPNGRKSADDNEKW
ncbi:hypothetical protein THASP1DRAFT_28072 [Thamnocephalis sphaerospora]|uniref:Uncharacterized protein n=1 Tax=Thamnocephalis sphaerospora TaxID=78915 RepID=A0A4P9XVR2_9FUNG|nr:hypothetical protein THASP1DRAFT_28072 [Thamnocephalis sphaerospora]|eukprot:RKP10132.1 hypothetical protein THASP1DRAFT_28072 [Thamnocephalis sphaerospora]